MKTVGKERTLQRKITGINLDICLSNKASESFTDQGYSPLDMNIESEEGLELKKLIRKQKE